MNLPDDLTREDLIDLREQVNDLAEAAIYKIDCAIARLEETEAKEAASAS